ncbi:hypothetical protein COLO4_25462 [Corchorus olitorius]|uniref:Uncharacterized protein n=1 Tax=Corchorus olitorius TaxID=93759 RepID=A0A1R3I2M9_9ROSI|nr:hypothetical protein COLO4_25462 [Corchorus olitorius]
MESGATQPLNLVRLGQAGLQAGPGIAWSALA